MELVDMQDLKFCLSRGPGSSPGTGNCFIFFIFVYIFFYFFTFLICKLNYFF